MVGSVIRTAVSGLIAQERRFASAAERTLRATQALAAFEPFGRSANTTAPATPARRPAARPAEDDLVRGLVEQRLALHAYRANAAVLRNADRLQRETLDLIA